MGAAGESARLADTSRAVLVCEKLNYLIDLKEVYKQERKVLLLDIPMDYLFLLIYSAIIPYCNDFNYRVSADYVQKQFVIERIATSSFWAADHSEASQLATVPGYG